LKSFAKNRKEKENRLKKKMSKQPNYADPGRPSIPAGFQPTRGLLSLPLSIGFLPIGRTRL
jgi:hypothetical protein